MRGAFSTFLECSQMFGVFFYHMTYSLLHLLYDIDFTLQNNKNMLFLAMF